jgi:tryptophanyl-tRNA synthetase
LLPRADIVPVWEDQIPHIELARKVIKKVNTMFGTKYPLPKALISETPRLVWIDWNDKMSKSLWNTIFLTSTLKEIKTQVNKMYTDDWKITIQSKWNIEKHVVFKYLDIFYDDKVHLEELKKRYIAGGENSIWDWEIKKLLIDTLENFIAPIREKREYYLNNLDLVKKIIDDWAIKFRKQALDMIYDLKKNMWLLDYCGK